MQRFYISLHIKTRQTCKTGPLTFTVFLSQKKTKQNKTNFHCFSFQSSNFKFLSIQDSVTIQLMAAIRTPETTLFCIFFNINSELKENKNKNISLRGTTPLNQKKKKKKTKKHCPTQIPNVNQNRETLRDLNP